MIDLNTIKQQMETSKKLFSEINNQNRIFGELIDNAMKGAPDQDKPEISKLKLMATKAINLAKQGKSEEAQTLIKNFSNGNQNS